MRRAIYLASVATWAVATPALAQEAGSADQDGLAEIIVTAQKRAENVQQVPIAISAFTSGELQERAVTSVASLSNLSPNVTLDAGTPFSGSTSVLSAFIRGIGANDFAFNIDPGVGIYLDGVYLARSVGANQDLPDVERVEVLKGPQGTLFGRNTIGGAISIVTHEPGREFRFVGDITTGRYSLLQVRGMVDVPFTSSLSSSVSFSMKRRDGYLKRIAFPGIGQNFLPQETSFVHAGYSGIGYGTEGGDNTWSLRGKLKWDNGSSIRITLAGDYTDVDSSQMANSLIKAVPALGLVGAYNCAITACAPLGGGTPVDAAAQPVGGIAGYNALPALYGVNTDANPFNDRLVFDDSFLTGNKDTSYANGNNFSKLKSYGGAGTIEADVSDGLTVKSITAYRELHWSSGMEIDGSPLMVDNPSFKMNQWQFSQEFQLLGHALDKRLNYVLGAYYFKEKGDLHDYVVLSDGLLQVDGPNNLGTENYAFFGQVDFRPIDKLGFTIGGRYTHEDKEFEGFQSDNNGLFYKIFGLPINEASRQTLCGMSAALCYPNPGQPTRLYVAGVQNKKFNNFSPKVGVQYHPSDNIMAYGSWSRGYKTGGWTTRLTNPLPYAPDFDEEKAETWELGIKSTLIDRRLQLNAALFTTKYKDIQLNFQQGISPVLQNAGDARIKGFEVELTAAPTSGLTFTGSVGYTDAYYTRVATGAVVSADAYHLGVEAGAALPKTPKWKFNFSPRYELRLSNGGNVVILADYTHSSSLWNDTERSFLLQRDSTDIVNGTITYNEPADHWSLSVGMTNITNDRYLVTGQANLGAGLVYGTWSRPREWYAKLGVKF